MSVLAYQFGHELGHVTANSWQPHAKPQPPSRWLEEALVEPSGAWAGWPRAGRRIHLSGATISSGMESRNIDKISQSVTRSAAAQGLTRDPATEPIGQTCASRH